LLLLLLLLLLLFLQVKTDRRAELMNFAVSVIIVVLMKNGSVMVIVTVKTDLMSETAVSSII